jgi:predicted unusual protein kinase regulating ubiquinone biosynthesis (AarF/ABC1/UbiB family)
LFSAYLHQILIDGFFHADPHAGNVFVTDDQRLALLDLGMVARIDPAMQDRLIKLLLAVSQGNGGDAADIAIDIGRRLDHFDAEAFRHDATDLVGRNRGRRLRDVDAGSLVAELVRISGVNGLRLPPELTMLGKTLLNLDEVARILDPSFDPNEAIEAQTGELLRSRLLHTASPANIMSAAMEAKEFAERLPGRVNKVMDALAEGQLTLNVKGIDERDIMRSFQKLANRLVAGMVVAALVVGAALIMRVPTHTELLGYPAVAIVLFIIAAVAAISVLVSIVLSDLPQRRRRRG